MKINEFFDRLEKEFNISPYEYCKIKPISHSSLKKYLSGITPSRFTAEKIAHITGNKVSMKDLGFED